MSDIYESLRSTILQILQTPSAQDAICFRSINQQSSVIRAIERALAECDEVFEDRLDAMSRDTGDAE